MMALENRTQAGFSMIELMTGIAIGLFLLTGITGVFVANQITAQAKRNLDEVHESLRFVNMTLSRVIRQADDVTSNSTAALLEIESERPFGSPDMRDCAGALIPVTDHSPAATPPLPPLPPPQINRFYVENGQLMCRTVDLVTHLLAPGIMSVTFAYGADSNNDDRISAAEYVATPANWGDVRSVRVTLRFSEIRQESFVVTLRSKAF